LGSIRRSILRETSVTIAELTAQAIALPPAERAIIAQKLWESLEEEHAEISPVVETEAVAEAIRRDKELTDGVVEGIPHEEVMKNARRSIQCE
jgi:putative addiction module component (TIGR02574 family)